ncbi:MAG: HGGxSTG domain-containing protein [Candidatus Binatia bacterium]
MADYPMPRVHCGARTRAGGSCRQPAMLNGRCRIHGGKSKSGKEHGRYKHGYFTREAITDRRECAELLRRTRRILQNLCSPSINPNSPSIGFWLW